MLGVTSLTNSESAELPKLKSAIERTCLNDRSVSVALDSSLAMGSGWRLGFLGVLHMEVFQQRMSQEFDAEVIVTAPTVPYKITVHCNSHALRSRLSSG